MAAGSPAQFPAFFSTREHIQKKMKTDRYKGQRVTLLGTEVRLGKLGQWKKLATTWGLTIWHGGGHDEKGEFDILFTILCFGDNDKRGYTPDPFQVDSTKLAPNFQFTSGWRAHF
jgi:hypothetical protein